MCNIFRIIINCRDDTMLSSQVKICLHKTGNGGFRRAFVVVPDSYGEEVRLFFQARTNKKYKFETFNGKKGLQNVLNKRKRITCCF